MPTKEVEAEYNAVKNGLVTAPFLVDTVIDSLYNATSLVDTGRSAFGVISARYVRRHKLLRVSIKPRDVCTYDDHPAERIEAVVKLTLDVGSLLVSSFLYEVRRMEDQDMILGLPWMRKNSAVIDTSEKTITFKEHGITVHSVLPVQHINMISATDFNYWKHKATAGKAQDDIELFAISMADIEKALEPKQHGDPKRVLPTHCHEFLDPFNREKADKLPPDRGKGIDHGIDLMKTPDGKECEVPYGPF